jgi:diadenosine tetraphosphate (Ap4A) HIT family hydrolase
MLNRPIKEETLFQDGCEFCDEFTGGSSNSFYSRYKGCPKTRFLLSSENFQVFPTIGQLVEGYLLVAPKRHYATFDEVPSDLWAEIGRLHGLIRSELSDTYGSCIIYEHGARAPGNGGCGIRHAHLHAMPLAQAPDPVNILKQKFSYAELADLAEITLRGPELCAYLFYQDSDARLSCSTQGRSPRNICAKSWQTRSVRGIGIGAMQEGRTVFLQRSSG